MSIKKALLKYGYAQLGWSEQKEMYGKMKASSISDAFMRLGLTSKSYADVSVSALEENQLAIVKDVQTDLVVKEDSNAPYVYHVIGALEHLDDMGEILSPYTGYSGYLLVLWLKLPYMFTNRMQPNVFPEFTNTEGQSFLPEYMTEPIIEKQALTLCVAIKDKNLVPSMADPEYPNTIDREKPLWLCFGDGEYTEFVCGVDISGIVFKDLPEGSEQEPEQPMD